MFYIILTFIQICFVPHNIFFSHSVLITVVKLLRGYKIFLHHHSKLVCFCCNVIKVLVEFRKVLKPLCAIIFTNSKFNQSWSASLTEMFWALILISYHILVNSILLYTSFPVLQCKNNTSFDPYNLLFSFAGRPTQVTVDMYINSFDSINVDNMVRRYTLGCVFIKAWWRHQMETFSA